jgi:hypothetical protein
MSTLLHPNTPQEAHQRRGEIPPARTEDLAGIVIKGEHRGPAMLAQKLGHGREQGFGIEITLHLPMQPDRGARIHEIGNLHHMLLLAVGISRNTAGIFEIELDLLTRLPRLHRLGFATTILGNTPKAA